MINSFRVVVFLDLLVRVIAHSLPPSLWEATSYSDLLKFDGYGARLMLVHPIYDWLPLVLFIVALISLALFQNWGRFAFLLLWSLSTLGALVFGVRAVPPLLMFLGLLVATLDGLILAIVFFGPMREVFASRKAAQERIRAA